MKGLVSRCDEAICTCYLWITKVRFPALPQTLIGVFVSFMVTFQRDESQSLGRCSWIIKLTRVRASRVAQW